MLFLNNFCSQFLLCTILFLLMVYCVVAFVLDVHLYLGTSQYQSIYLDKHRSIHTFCKESDIFVTTGNRCVKYACRYLRCIQAVTKTEFTVNYKNTVFVTTV